MNGTDRLVLLPSPRRYVTLAVIYGVIAFGLVALPLVSLCTLPARLAGMRFLFVASLILFCLLAVVFAAASVFCIRRIRSRVPLLIVDAQGVRFMEPFTGFRRLSWSEIESFDRTSWKGGTYLAITPAASWSDGTDAAGWWRSVRSFCSRFTPFRVMIPLSALEDAPDDLLVRIGKIRDAATSAEKST